PSSETWAPTRSGSPSRRSPRGARSGRPFPISIAPPSPSSSSTWRNWAGRWKRCAAAWPRCSGSSARWRRASPPSIPGSLPRTPLPCRPRRAHRGPSWSGRSSAASRARSSPSWPSRSSRGRRRCPGPRPTPRATRRRGRNCCSIESARERSGELRTLGLVLVLEERGDLAGKPGAAHPGGPVVEIGLGIVQSPQAQVAEGSGAHAGSREVFDLGDAKRRSGPLERPEGLVREPARVAELERGGNVAGKLLEELREEGVVALQVGRKLVEDGTQFRSERARRIAEGGDHRARLAQPRVMGDALPRLEREPESFRNLRGPPADQLLRRVAAEGVIDLDRGKLRRVVRKHLRPGQILRVEAAAPRLVVVAARTAENAHQLAPVSAR